MRQAIRESRNVPAVKFLQQYSGIEDTIQTARDLGITIPFTTLAVILAQLGHDFPYRFAPARRILGREGDAGEGLAPELLRHVVHLAFDPLGLGLGEIQHVVRFDPGIEIEPQFAGELLLADAPIALAARQ